MSRALVSPDDRSTDYDISALRQGAIENLLTSIMWRLDTAFTFNALGDTAGLGYVTKGATADFRRLLILTAEQKIAAIEARAAFAKERADRNAELERGHRELAREGRS